MAKSIKDLTADAEPELVANVAKMNKMDFVDFYVAAGYDRVQTGELWHVLRRTPKVHKIMDNLRRGAQEAPAIQIEQKPDPFQKKKKKT